MHGFNLGSTFLVNAEVHSMGGIVDDGVGIDTKPSPRRAAIEKAQAELRLEYDVREERRRELEFLEKGGDPLDFKFGHATSVSVQSTSHTHQHPDQNLTSEAKGSFALTASPHGDSVESSGRLGVTIACEPNSADNFDGENETLQSDRKSRHPGRCSVTPSEHSSPLDGCRNVKDSEDSPIFHPKKGQAYRRRNRSRTNRDGPCSSSADLVSCRGNDSMPARSVVLSKPVASETQFEMESDGTHVMHLSTPKVTEFAEEKLNLSNLKEKVEEVQNPSLKEDEAPVAIRIIECPPSSGAEVTDDNATSAQLNETSMINGNIKCSPTDTLIKNVPVMIKGLDSESSCTQTNVAVDGNRNIGSDLCNNLKKVDSNGSPKEPTLTVRENSATRDDKLAIEEHVTDAMETAACIMEDKSSISLQENGFPEDHAEVDRGKPSLKDKVEGLSNVEVQEQHNNAEMKSETELAQLDDFVPKTESSCLVRPLVDSASNELNRNGLSGPYPVLELPSTENQPKPLDKAQEDRILEEARMIEAKRKRISELSISLLPREHRHKCHWDLVLEEMAWLANDFAQERLWKMTAAAQICRRVAFASRIRLEEQRKFSKQKSVAHTLAKSVMEFWNSARLSVDNANSSSLEKSKHEASPGVHETDKTSEDVLQSTRRKQDHDVYEYAVRFLEINHYPKPFVEVEVPGVTDVPCDVDLPEVSWQDHFTEENLFYAVPPGAIEMYRKSIETCLEECESAGINTREEVDTSGRDALAECDYEEDEGENLYYLPGASNTGKPSKKIRKNMKSCTASSYDFEGDFGYGTQQLNVLGKRPTNSLHVDPIPTKRMRTASRQRVVGPFGAGPANFTPILSTAGASSGDTNSFQDDQSTQRGGSVVPRGSEVDSAMNFEKTYDSAEMSAKPKKKKKIKHPRVSYDQRWQLDSSMQNEQKNLVRQRLENHQLESNGNGSFGQLAKKPKLTKLSLDNSFDNTAPMSGSVASPVASQMSNMSSQTKIIKFIGGRDRGKKGKGLKVSTGQLGSGSPWTIVEDQALVVLVHDMGPNWELVSDAINNILQFKCIFRKPPECKERHKFLMDRPSGDGADSAEDSGSSQPYPSTLPGIPKGSARQLFRSLHAHVEEDNIKSRFEKIICIQQQLEFRKKKNDNEDLKKIVPVHGSHVLSLSQVIPNNVNGGVLTPLDLCDTATSNQDPLSLEYKPLPNQSNITPMHTPGGPNSSLQGLQGPSSMGIGNNLASPPSQFTSPRDVRYSIPRPGSLPIEEQQRLHHYNPMLPGRNVQASTMSSSGPLSGPDRGVRTHPGMNRSIPMARPGVPGITSSMVNSGNVLASNLGGVSSNMNVHSGTASGHGNPTFRPRDSLHGIRPGQSSEHQRQVVLPEMQIQTTQTNTSGVPPFGGLSSSPLPTFPGLHHAATPEQQAYLRLARDRQIHQRLQRQQHPTSSPLMMQGGPQLHQQQKNLQGHGRSPQSGPINQGDKQRFQQSGRQHPQQSQQAKLVKGIGRGNMPVHQNLPMDTSHLNGLSANTVNPVSENIYSGSSLNIVPLSKPLASPASPSHVQPQKPYGNTGPGPTSKPVHRVSSHLEGGNPGPDQGIPSSSVVHSRNHHQPALQRTSQQNQVNSDSLTKSQVNHPQAKQQALSVGQPSECVKSASNVVRKVTGPTYDLGPTSSQPVVNPLSSEPFSPSNNLVSHAHESQWQQQESQLQAPPLQPILSQKQSRQQLQQVEHPPQKVLQSQSQPQIQGGQNVVITKTTNSRLD